MRASRVGFSLSATLLVLGLSAASAAADPTAGPRICPGTETAIAGHYRNLRITGNSYVPSGTTLRVTGNVTISRGACLDAFTLGTVHVGGNLRVERGAILALGCTPGSIGPGPPCNGETTGDTIGGNVLANHPFTMYLVPCLIRT